MTRQRSNQKDTTTGATESQSTKHSPRSASKAAVWTLSILSALIVVGITVAGLTTSSLVSLADSPSTIPPAKPQKVSQTLLSTYCPAQLGLRDQGSYGDSEFTASQGDLSSAAHYAALGSVYDATLNSVSGKKLATLNTGNDSQVLGGRNAAAPGILDTTLLSAQAGTGSLASVASWASQGDVQGLASTNCVGAALTSSFLVPATTTGNVNTLVVANTSDKPTSVDVEIWGAASGQPIASSTDSTLTVAANSEKILDLSAAAPDQKGLFITVSSEVVPVFSVVQTSEASGLTSRGVEYSSGLNASSGIAMMPGLSKGQQVSLRAFSKQRQTAKISWVGTDGAKRTKSVTLPAHQVAIDDVGTVPDDATSLQVQTQSDAYLSAQVSVAGSKQQDYAMLVAPSPVTHSGLTLPDGLTASLVIANSGSTPADVTLRGFGKDGARVATQKLTVGSGSSTSVKWDDKLKDAVTVSMTTTSKTVTWAAPLSSPSLAGAGVAQASVLQATSLMPQKATVTAERSTLVSAQ